MIDIAILDYANAKVRLVTCDVADDASNETDSAWSKVNAMYDELRRQKYKRCVAMVEWCSYKSECFDQYSRHTAYLPNIEKYRRKRNHYADRCNKLLLLAEKFKEAK